MTLFFLNVSNVYAFLTNIFQSEKCLIPKTSCILFTTPEIHFKDKPQLKKINFKRENVGNLQHLDQTKLSRLPLQITHAIL